MRMSNAKGRLQELLQGRGVLLPTYVTGGVAGHWKCEVKVEWEGDTLSETAEAPGKKKDVEKLAAEKMLSRLLGRKTTPTRTSPASLSTSARSPSLSPSSPFISAHPCPSVPAETPIRSFMAKSKLASRLSPPVQAETPTHPLMANSKLASRLSPSPLASCARSPVSLLQERLQRLGLALPRYSEEVATDVAAFKCRCVVLNSRGVAVLAAEGKGSSKHRAKEKAAEMMLKKVEECCRDKTFERVHLYLSPSLYIYTSNAFFYHFFGFTFSFTSSFLTPSPLQLSPLPTQDPTYPDTHPEVLDGDLDSDIAFHLHPYDPQFLYMQERGCHFCLAWFSLPSSSSVSSSSSFSVLPIAAHGSGDTASSAKRQASCNLLANLHALASS